VWATWLENDFTEQNVVLHTVTSSNMLLILCGIVAKKPIILLLFTAGPVNISEAKDHPNVGVILLCFYPGQGAGDALRRVLAFSAGGTVVSPAARLPFTWPASLEQVNYTTLFQFSFYLKRGLMMRWLGWRKSSLSGLEVI